MVIEIIDKGNDLLGSGIILFVLVLFMGTSRITENNIIEYIGWGIFFVMIVAYELGMEKIRRRGESE